MLSKKNDVTSPLSIYSLKGAKGFFHQARQNSLQDGQRIKLGVAQKIAPGTTHENILIKPSCYFFQLIW